MEYHINLRELEERGKKAADYKWDHEQRACGLMAQLAIAERLEAIAEVLQNLYRILSFPSYPTPPPTCCCHFKSPVTAQVEQAIAQDWRSMKPNGT